MLDVLFCTLFFIIFFGFCITGMIFFDESITPKFRHTKIYCIYNPLKREKKLEENNFKKISINMDLQCYGYLFGKLKLIKDNHHDEVFIEQNNLVVIENSRWLYTYKELVAIANEIER